MTADPEQLSAGHAIRITTAGHAAAPTDGSAGTAPDYVSSPATPDGEPTDAIMVALKSPTAPAATTPATALSGGFTVTVWMRNPVTRQWGSTAAFSAAYDQWFVTGDIRGGELYFQIANVNAAGSIDINILEV